MLKFGGDFVRVGGIEQLRSCPHLREVELFGRRLSPSVPAPLRHGSSIKVLTIYCDRFEPGYLHAGAGIEGLKKLRLVIEPAVINPDPAAWTVDLELVARLQSQHPELTIDVIVN